MDDEVKTPQKKSAYWERLRKDKPSAIGAFLFMLALAPFGSLWAQIVYTPPDGIMRRGDPGFWMVSIPILIWAIGIMDYKKWSVVVMKYGFILLPAFAVIGAFIKAAPHDTEALYLYGGMALICLILNGAAYGFYRRSLLRREGPFTGQP